MFIEHHIGLTSPQCSSQVASSPSNHLKQRNNSARPGLVPSKGFLAIMAAMCSRAAAGVNIAGLCPLRLQQVRSIYLAGPIDKPLSRTMHAFKVRCGESADLARRVASVPWLAAR